MPRPMRAYPGLTGVPTAHPKWDSLALTSEDQQRLRTQLEAEPKVGVTNHVKFEDFFSDLIHCCHLYRRWAVLADESKPLSRIANVKARRAWLKRKGSTPTNAMLSSVNLFWLRRIQGLFGCDEQAGLDILLKRLSALRVTRGQRPRDEILFLVDSVCQAYNDAFSRDISTTKEGEFERIAVCALTIASSGERRSVRPHLDEYRSSAEVVEEGSYLDKEGTRILRPRTFAPPRIAARTPKSSI